jgi:hypothetical protein
MLRNRYNRTDLFALVPLWRFKTPEIARESSLVIYK